jgi:hypothetical protein
MCTDLDLGFGLSERWVREAEVMAEGAPWVPPWREAPPRTGSVTVHRVRQHCHLGEDAYYVVRDLWVDPRRRVRVAKSPTGGPTLAIPRGTFRIACRKTLRWGPAPAPLTLRSIKARLRLGPLPEGAAESDLPTLFVSRDGTGNVFHGMADLVNAFLMRSMCPYEQIVFLDDHDDGPLAPLWPLLAPRPVLRLAQLSGPVIVRAAAFSPPGGCCFLWKNWERVPPECVAESPLLKAFRQFILDGLAIPPARHGRPVITLIRRRYRGGAPTADRRISNEDALVSALGALGGVDVQAVDFAEMPYVEQVQRVSETDVLIGMHGAGLTNLLWLPPGAGVIELMPSPEGVPLTYANMAMWLGRRYAAWRHQPASAAPARRGKDIPELGVDAAAVAALAREMLP